jgi:hypothetical protein
MIPWWKSFCERLGLRHDAEVEQHLVPEAGVEQVEHGVLGAADVEIGHAPIFQRLGAGEGARVLRVEETQVIPARAGPLRHGVGLAAGADPGIAGGFRLGGGHGGAGRDLEPDFKPCGLVGERAFARAARQIGLHVGQHERQRDVRQRQRVMRDAVFCEGDRLCGQILADGRGAAVIGFGDPDDGKGLAPVALAREEPVAELVVDRAISRGHGRRGRR